MTRSTVLFTDLDGSLLDHDTYLPGPAAPALDSVISAGVWVFFCSAKTLPEQKHLAERLGCDVGYITENGAMAVLPRDAGRHRFGVSYQEIRTALALASRETGIDATGYGDMTTAEIAAITGLDVDQADLARRRCCSETLVDLDDHEAALLGKALTHHGLRLQRGARFWTVQGEHDKGTAIGWVLDQLGGGTNTVASYAIGDGPNDVSMLRHVDHPMLVKSVSGTWADLDVDDLVRLDGVGPAGWVEAASHLLRSFE